MGNNATLHTNYHVQQKIEQTTAATELHQYSLKAPDAGAFGKVQRCIDTRTQRARAVKHIEKTNSQRRDEVLHEIEMMRMVSGKHKHIVEFVEYFEEGKHFDLIFDFCDKGSLESMIEKQELTKPKTVLFSYQFLTALAFLKKIGILHRDVKPPNILLKDADTCKLGDFGSSCTHSESGSLFQIRGTPAYFSPEMCLLPRGTGYSFPCDVWAAGVTVYMMCFKGEHPFMVNGKLDVRLLRHSLYSVGWMQVWDASATQFMRWLLMPAPWQRIRVEDACNHSWLASHGFGNGSFTKSPPTKLVPDNYASWYEDPWS